MLNYDPIIHKISVNGSVPVDVLRLDLLHTGIPGNKWFKLKYNLLEVTSRGYEGLMTFGGAFSNHIAATAAAGKLFNVKTIGVIRGEQSDNETLQTAQNNGMRLHYISREAYRRKDDPDLRRELTEAYGNYFIVPEGGNNQPGILGCTEIIRQDWHYDYIFCACGTGTTFAGILKSTKSKTIVGGINVLKGANQLVSEVNGMLGETSKLVVGNEALQEQILKSHFITDRYAFGGYAKYHSELIRFKKQFEAENGLILDYVYTCKLFYAVEELIRLEKIPAGSKILVIHSGGQQGNKAFEERFKIIA